MKLHELREKSNRFCENINVNIAQSIESVDSELTSLNKKQMLNSKDSEDKPFIHSRTGSEFLSKAYAKRTGKKKPNLFEDGTFQGEMFLSVDENKMTWFIDSFWDKTKYLITNYGLPIFGIAPSNQDRAKQITFKAFTEKYKSLVLK